MRLLIGSCLMVKLKYVFTRGDACYWQRRIPRDLADRYPSSAPLKINLQTTDPKTIALKVSRLNRQHEALWDAMRKDSTLTPGPARDAAKSLLATHGLDPRAPDENALSYFIEQLDKKREKFAEQQADPEEAYHLADPSEFLSPTEQKALELLTEGEKFLLSDALDVYLAEHLKRGQEKFETYTRRVWAKLLAHLGDRPFAEVSRSDAKSFRDQLLALGAKTTTVRRNVNVVRAVFASAIVEKSLNIPNVWESLKIAGLGSDSEQRESLSSDELARLRKLCRAKDDDMRWLLAIQLDTGARVGEVAGLALADIVLGHEVPHIWIRPHPWRTLKTANSARKVPLVGDALWAAGRVISSAGAGQVHAFPRYVKEGQCQTDGASAALNKWMRNNEVLKTTHELRHTMRDRLRNSGAPRDIQDAVGGWGRNTAADGYGEGYALGIMREALARTL